MNDKPSKKRSITEGTVRATINSCLILAGVALLIGLAVYGAGLIRQYAVRSFKLAGQVREAVTNASDAVGLSKEVMEIYRSLTPEQRAAEDNLDHYAALEAKWSEDGAAQNLFNIMKGYVIEVDAVYLGMYDGESGNLVYILDADPNEATRMRTGEWELVAERECSRFLHWNGDGPLYDISYMQKYGWICTAGYPVEDENGEVCSFVLVDVLIGSLSGNLLEYASKITLSLIAATALIAWLVVRYMNKTVTKPIEEITAAAEAYVADKKAGIEKEHFTGIETGTGIEIENLADVMAQMEKENAQYEDDLTRITADRERMLTELDMARRIQAATLPNVFPPFPDRTEFDLYASMEPAKKVGGDFYDYYLLDDDHLCLVIADVSGKGIPAALFMMTSKALLKSYAKMGKSVPEILETANETICANNLMELFVTVWLGILEISTGKIVASNAGHEYPVLMKNGVFELIKDRHGLVIGGLAGVKYSEYELQLQPGDKLFLYTDGVPEATDAENGMFGTERMLQALNAKPDATPEDVLKNVRTAMDEFVQGAEQFDDITMLCVEYKGKKTG